MGTRFAKKIGCDMCDFVTVVARKNCDGRDVGDFETLGTPNAQWLCISKDADWDFVMVGTLGTASFQELCIR